MNPAPDGNRQFYNAAELEIAKHALLRACSATKKARHRNPETGQIDYVDVPAWEFIIPAATKVIEFGRGKAMTTAIVASVDATSTGRGAEDAFLASIAEDPAAIAALEDAVSKIKEAAKETARAKKAIPINVTPVERLPKPSTSSS